MRKRPFSAAFLLFCLAVYGIPTARGQAVSGAITGYAYDPSEAPIAGATVTVKNVDTGITTTRNTDSTGLYLITNLNPGTYSVAVEAAGFRRFVQENVVLRVDSTMRIDAHLLLGELTQEVSVTAAPPLLNTEKTDVGETIAEQTLQSLPTSGRNLSKLYNLIPGVVQNFFQIGVGENPSEFNGVLVNGSFFGTSEYQIDGITDANSGHSGFQVIVPNQESVQEIKITTADYDPEFGSAAGLVAQYVTKSGTNDIHGSLFHFLRNSATFAADPFTEKIPGTGKDGKGFGPAPFKWNQGGFSLGGPIKKNRMFLFGDYQLTRTRQGGSLTATVPNDAFRAGDFSALAAGNPIFDPLTGNPDGTGRQQFSCNGVLNVICRERISSVATNILGLLPRPNLSQDTDVNYAGGGTVLFNQDQFDIRHDWNISDKDKFFARYTYFSAFLDNPPLFGKKAGGPAIGGLSPQTGDFRSQHVALNYTHTLNPSLLAEVRLGLVRFRLDSLQADKGLKTDDEVGIPNINSDDPLTQGLAGITVGGPVGDWTMGITSGVGLPRFDRTTVIEIVNNWTKIKGSHQFRWGTDIRRTRSNLLGASGPSSRGNFEFDQVVTSSADLPGSGLGMATFLLGLPTHFDRGLLTLFPGDRHTKWSFYGQDIWRVTPKLTVNYGLRYDYFSPFTPAFTGGEVNFDPNKGDLILAGLGDVSRSANVKGDFNNFSPRLGIAYKLLQKTVIRAGFGRSYYASNYGGGAAQLTSNFPIIQSQSIDQTNIYKALFPIAQGPPAPTPATFPSSGHLPVPPGNFLNTRDFNKQIEHVDSWNLTVEHQVAQDFRLSVAYVGNAATVWDDTNINRAPSGPGDLLSRRPFFQKFGIDGTILYDCTCLHSNYSALQLVVEKRFSKGYSFNSSYTWAKALDTEPGGFGWGDQDNNPIDRKGSYGISTYNRASVWTLSHTWQLPYGKRTPYGTNAVGVKKALLAGWNFNGITTVESGFPISPILGDASTLNGDFGQRPDRVPGVDPYAGGHTREQWFNPAAFVAPAACCRWGNAGRGILRGPGLASSDWAFWKEFEIRERMKLQFRWENFNFFNRANLGQPDNSVESTNTTAGRITSLGGAGSGFGSFPMRRMQFGLRLSW